MARGGRETWTIGMSSRLPREELHDRQATMMSAVVRARPPRLRGMRWSPVRSSIAPQYSHHGRSQIASSRSRSQRLSNPRCVRVPRSRSFARLQSGHGPRDPCSRGSSFTPQRAQRRKRVMLAPWLSRHVAFQLGSSRTDCPARRPPRHHHRCLGRFQRFESAPRLVQCSARVTGITNLSVVSFREPGDLHGQEARCFPAWRT
jgi:hypothetical protein